MKKALTAAAVIAIVAGAWFFYVLYKVGEEMKTYRCGFSRRDF